MQLVKITKTGAQLKALFTNPTVNTSETVRLESGILGVTSGNILVVSLYLENVVDPSQVINFNTDGTYNTSLAWYSGGPPPYSTGPSVIVDGNLDVTVSLLFPGHTLSDLNDDAEFNLYLCAGVM